MTKCSTRLKNYISFVCLLNFNQEAHLSSYIPIRPGTIHPDDTVDFDAYLFIDQHYIHYLKLGTTLKIEDLKRIKDKKIKKFFIPRDQEEAYLKYLDRGLQSLSNSNKTIQEKSQIANDSMVTISENAERTFETETGFVKSKEQLSKVVDFIGKDRAAIKGILEISNLAQDDYQHCASVAGLSISVAKRLAITEEKDLQDLGLAALVHDIGKTKLKIPLTSFNREKLSDDDRKQYERHPSLALEILSGKSHITPRILGLIAKHEELAFGRGYPEKLNMLQEDKLYQILSLCNDYDRTCRDLGLDLLKGIDPFFEKRADLHDQNLIMTLSAILV